MASTVDGNLVVTGTLAVQTGVTLPSASLLAANIAALAGIETSKVDHRHVLHVAVAPGTTITALTEDIAIMRAAGSIVAIEAAITGTIATGADRTVTVDLHKSTGAGAFATALSATIGFTNASVLRTVAAGTVSSPTLADGDILRVVVTVAGAAGNQALGLVVTVTWDEDYAA